MTAPFRRPAHEAAAGDPIPFTHEGRTHLFYLSSPSGTTEYPERVRTSWQHIATDDFSRWDEYPAALEPGEPGAYDAGGIWTGSVVENDGTFYLFYTGHHVGADNPQTICLATSTDLVTFTRHDGNPLILPVDGCEPVDWRDPYVFFNEDERKWWMLIAARRSTGPEERRGCIMLATSDDLVAWSVENEPLYAPDTTYCPECPELWRSEADGEWYLVYSRFSERVGTIYRVAGSPRGPFRRPADERLGGRRWYAAKSAAHEDGRVYFGWIHDRIDTGGEIRWLWGGDFALPRYGSASGGTITIVPVDRSLEHWGRRSAADERELRRPSGMQQERVIDRLPVSALIRLSWTPVEPTRSFGLVLTAEDSEAAWRLSFDLVTGVVELAEEPAPLDDFWADLTGSGPSYRGVDGPIVASASLTRGASDGIEAVITLDDELLEVYVPGANPLTHRIARASELSLDVFVEEGVATTSTVLFEPLEDVKDVKDVKKMQASSGSPIAP